MEVNGISGTLCMRLSSKGGFSMYRQAKTGPLRTLAALIRRFDLPGHLAPAASGSSALSR